MFLSLVSTALQHKIMGIGLEVESGQRFKINGIFLISFLSDHVQFQPLDLLKDCFVSNDTGATNFHIESKLYLMVRQLYTKTTAQLKKNL